MIHVTSMQSQPRLHRPIPVHVPPSRALAWGLQVLHVIILIIIFALATACGGPNVRKATLTAELAALNAARDTFVKWDKDYQLMLVDTAATKEEARARVAQYRVVIQSAIETLFVSAYQAISNAAMQDDETTLKTAQKISAVVSEGIGKLKGGAGPPTALLCAAGVKPPAPITCP